MVHIGETGDGGAVRSRKVRRRLADGGREAVENQWGGVREMVRGLQGVEADMDRIRRESAVRGEGSDDDGPAELVHLRLIEGIAAVDGVADAGGATRKRIVEAGGHSRDVIEGEDVIVQRDVE